MSERVFRGKQASWHVEFIGKLVSLDQAKLDAAGGDATLADKAWLWLTKAKRGELIMPSTEDHSSPGNSQHFLYLSIHPSLRL